MQWLKHKVVSTMAANMKAISNPGTLPGDNEIPEGCAKDVFKELQQ